MWAMQGFAQGAQGSESRAPKPFSKPTVGIAMELARNMN
jgi:hypothetical protein